MNVPHLPATVARDLIDRLLPSFPLPLSLSTSDTSFASTSVLLYDACQIAWPNFRLQMLLPCSRYSERDTSTFASPDCRDTSVPQRYASVVGLKCKKANQLCCCPVSKNNLAEFHNQNNLLLTFEHPHLVLNRRQSSQLPTPVTIKVLRTRPQIQSDASPNYSRSRKPLNSAFPPITPTFAQNNPCMSSRSDIIESATAPATPHSMRPVEPDVGESFYFIMNSVAHQCRSDGRATQGH